jgi:hypothetical protein
MTTAWDVQLRPAGDGQTEADPALAGAMAEARKLAAWSCADAAVARIAEAAGITPDVLRGPCRRVELVELRRIAARYLRGQGLSLGSIGRALGDRDHTTVRNLLLGPRSTRATGRTA